VFDWSLVSSTFFKPLIFNGFFVVPLEATAEVEPLRTGAGEKAVQRDSRVGGTCSIVFRD